MIGLPTAGEDLFKHFRYNTNPITIDRTISSVRASSEHTI